MVKALAALAVVPLLLGAAADSEGTQEVLFRFQDSRITEASALLALPGGRFATTNDSGDVGRVFVVDDAGDTVGQTRWSADPTDVEALAQCRRGSVWVGDIGDNQEARDAVQVAEVPIGVGERTVSPTTYDLRYPDGAHDAESLVCHPRTGRLYVATKEWAGGRLYAAPKRLRPEAPNRLRPVGPVKALATDASFFPDGRHLIVRGYLSATIHRWPGLAQVGSVQLPAQQQGEGIAVAGDGAVYASSEGRRSPVVAVRLPSALRKEVARQPSAPASPSPRESPGASAPDRHEPAAETEPAERDLWPWILGGLVGLAIVVVLLRSLRPR